MNLPEELNFPPTESHDIYAAKHVYVISQSMLSPSIYTLHEIDAESRKIYADSAYCQRNSRVMTAETLANYNLYNLTLHPEQLVIVFQESEGYIDVEQIQDAGEFLNWLVFADKYSLNIPYALTLTRYNVWFLLVKERQRAIWNRSKILLTNVDQRDFERPKFMGVGAHAVYPVGASTMPKSIEMKDVTAPELSAGNRLGVIIEFLHRAGATEYLTKLIIILASSVEYCDLILKDEDILKVANNIPNFPYALFFGLRVMYLEEVGMWKKGRPPGRFIMPINAVAAMPQIQTPNLGLNPYIVTILRRVCIESNLIIPAKIIGNRGVHTLKRFEERFNIATKGLFKYINWNKSAANGSLVSAAAIINPLENMFDSFSEYLEEYYPSYDSTENVVIDSGPVDTLFDVVEEEVEEPEAEQPTNLHPEFSDMDLMISTDTMEEFDEIAQSHYQAILKSARENPEFAGKISRIIMERVDTENKYRYHIKGLHRVVEIYHVRGIPQTIVRFHLACVRLWYDGSQVYCFPSFVTAAMTGLNIDIRWVSCNKDLRDVVMKYFSRGFGTLLNSADRRSLIHHIQNPPANSTFRWPDIGPPHNGGGFNWRARRYWNELLFHDRLDIFNPSFYRFGIHSGNGTVKHRITLPKLNARARGKTIHTFIDANTGLPPYQTGQIGGHW